MKSCKELDFILKHRESFSRLDNLITSMLVKSVPAGFRELTTDERLNLRNDIQLFTNLLNDLMYLSPCMPSDMDYL